MKVDLYRAELQNRSKESMESWGDFADEVCVLVEKAYPDLEEGSRECIALNHYLSQLNNPQIAFGVKQRRPKSVLDAVTATIELESLLLTIPSIPYP